jgi:hypothetical protein
MIFPVLVSMAAEEDRDGPRSQHFTKKDLKWVVVLLILLAIILPPVYNKFKKDSDEHVCITNMNAIYKALSLYANDHDDRFPPIAWEENPTTGEPNITNGKVTSWVTQAFHYDQRPEIFHCPAAEADESVPTEGAVRKAGDTKATHLTINSNYGMYVGYAAAMQSSIDNEDQVILFAETSNSGSQKSYDPYPFLDSAGKQVPYDGFSIGWNDANKIPTLASRSVTRLSFRDSANGDFKNATGRHGDEVHAMAPGGNLIMLHPSDARLERRAGDIQGRWSVPALLGH